MSKPRRSGRLPAPPPLAAPAVAAVLLPPLLLLLLLLTASHRPRGADALTTVRCDITKSASGNGLGTDDAKACYQATIGNSDLQDHLKVVCGGPGAGADACKDATVQCPQDHDCFVECTGEDTSCIGAFSVLCPDSPHLCAVLDFRSSETFDPAQMFYTQQHDVVSRGVCSGGDGGTCNSNPFGLGQEAVKRFYVVRGPNSNTDADPGHRIGSSVPGTSVLRTYCPTDCSTCWKTKDATCHATNKDHDLDNCDLWHDGKFHMWCGPVSAGTDCAISGTTAVAADCACPNGGGSNNCATGKYCYDANGDTSNTCNDVAQATCAKKDDGLTDVDYACADGYTIKSAKATITCAATPCATNAIQNAACCDADPCSATESSTDDGADGNFYCTNGGTVSGFTGDCSCTNCNPGYSGDNCQTANSCSATESSTDDGADGNFYCTNGGTVSGFTGDCSCTNCNPGYSGDNCQTADSCSATESSTDDGADGNFYCTNGGTVSGFTGDCSCTNCNPGYSGDNCQTADSCSATESSTDDGADGNFYCTNGGTVSGFTGDCSCTNCNPGYSGDNCQTADSCSATESSTDDGADGNFYCTNGGTVSGFTGACTCNCTGTRHHGPNCATSRTGISDSTGQQTILTIEAASWLDEPSTLIEGGRRHRFRVSVSSPSPSTSSLTPPDGVASTTSCAIVRYSNDGRQVVSTAKAGHTLLLHSSESITGDIAAATNMIRLARRPTLILSVFAPHDTMNGQPASRNYSLECTLHPEEKTSRLALYVTNVVRPVVGDARLAFDDLGQSYGASLARYSVGLRHLEIRTSGRAFLKLLAHTGVTGPCFVSPTVRRFGVVVANSTVVNNNTVLIPVPDQSDDRTATVLLPTFAEACGAGDHVETCSFGLTIQNALSPKYGRGGTFQCPMPGNQAARSPCFADPGNEAGGNGAGSVWPTPETAAGSLSLPFVIKYVAGCLDPKYLPIGSEECVVLETATHCAFGAKDECRPCPYGAECPGGYEARSFRGFFTVDSSKGEVEPCPAPRGERCVGFDLRSGSTMCGFGDTNAGFYESNNLTSLSSLADDQDQGRSGFVCYEGALCGYCCDNFYQSPDHRCLKCPENGREFDAFFDSLWQFCTVVGIWCLLILGAVYWLERAAHPHEEISAGSGKFRRDQAVYTAVRQTKEFGIWLFLSGQVMATASSAPAPGQPSWLDQVYRSVALFNADSSFTVHPTCIGGSNPFAVSWLVLGGILVLAVLQLATFGFGWVHHHHLGGKEQVASAGTKGHSVCDGRLASLQGKNFVVLSLLFNVVVKNVLSILHCREDPLTRETVLFAGSDRIVCWEGEHLRLGALAVVVLVLYVTFYPIASAIYIHANMELKEKTKTRELHEAQERRSSGIAFGFDGAKARNNAAFLERWEHFIGDDYQPKFFWFRHIYWAVNLGLLLVYEFSQQGAGRCVAIVLLLAAYMALLLRFRPFTRIDAWKLYVRGCLVVCSVFIAILNAIIAAEYEAAGSAEVKTLDGGLSLAWAYVCFASLVCLTIVLPLSFFWVNYGCCCRRCGGVCVAGAVPTSESPEELELSKMERDGAAARSPPDGWSRHADPDTGAFYLFHDATGEAKWEAAEGGGVAAGASEQEQKNPMYPQQDAEMGERIWEEGEEGEGRESGGDGGRAVLRPMWGQVAGPYIERASGGVHTGDC